MDTPGTDSTAAPSSTGNLLVQLLALVALLLWVAPMLLRFVGLAPAGRWLAASPWHRMSLAPVLLVLAVLSQTSGRRLRESRRRVAWAAFARSIGGTVEEAEPRLQAGIWRRGPIVRAPGGKGGVTCEVLRDRQQAWTVIRAPVAGAGGLAFRLAPRRSGGLGGLDKVATAVTRARLAEAQGDAQDLWGKQAPEALSLLAAPETRTGNRMLDESLSLRTNDGEAVRRMLESPAIGEPLRRLMSSVTGWTWSVVPDPGSQTALASVTLAGADLDPEHLRAAYDLLCHGLDFLAA